MASVQWVTAELGRHANEQTRGAYVRHGAREDQVYGVKIADLKQIAKRAAAKIRAINVNMGNTACKVPNAIEGIDKIESMGRIGKKRVTIRC